MRTVDEGALARATEKRFRSEYDYAVFEYLRSGKVIQALERAGTPLGGRVLDAGCGGGGTAVSLAEESTFAVGLDLDARFLDSGTRLVRERGVRNAAFVQGDGARLPFRASAFDECHRVLRPGGVLYLSTAPYLSLAGAHLPRLLVPVPLHLLVGRRVAFGAFRLLARRAPWLLREPKEANTFIALAEQGKSKQDDLLQRVTVRRLRAWVREAGFDLVREERHVTGFFRRVLPPPARRLLERAPLARDVMIGHIQCVLVKA